MTYDFPNSIVTHFEGITGAGGAGNDNVVGDVVLVQNRAERGFFLPIRSWLAGTPIPLGNHPARNNGARSRCSRDSSRGRSARQ